MPSDPTTTPPAGAGPATRAVHAGRRPDPVTGAALPPIVQSTTYVQEDVGVDRGYTYSRSRNPTVTALEEALADHEGAAHATAWASGMAAVTGLALTVLRGGDHVVCSRSVYGGTLRLLEQVLSEFGVTATFADARRPEAVAGAVRDRTRLILLETPGNPTLDLADVAAAAQTAREAGALLAVDNTFLTGALQRPLELGAHVAIHSTTKFLDGHNAAVGGALVTDDPELDERLRHVRKTVGSIQSPFGAWLTHQGLTTLPLRMERHSAGALGVARWLTERPEIRRVLYPFLPQFPQHDLARRQQRAGGGVVTFELDGGEDAARWFLRELRLCRLAESLGAAQTLATHPVTMTHADVPEELRRALGVTPGLVRLSVGLEEAGDVIADLDRALPALPRAERGPVSPPRSGRLPGPPAIGAQPPPDPPLRVALLGLGTVGGGVYRHLAALPRRYSVVSVLVREADRPRDVQVAPGLLTDDPEEALAPDCDGVVELVGGLEAPLRFVTAALRRGRHVVTANKLLLAERGAELERRAREAGLRLLDSAAVGGGVPMLETVRRRAEAPGVVGFRGVLNGTTNFVLERVAAGASLEEALAEARRLGLAEADPGADLSGADAAAKTLLLCRAATGLWVSPERITVEALGPDALAAARNGRAVVRQVARAELDVRPFRLTVAPEVVDPQDPLARIEGEDNALVLHLADGSEEVLRGPGAGRGPTALSVLSDLEELRREVSAAPRRRVAPRLRPAAREAAE